YEQYLRYFVGVARGDFGISIADDRTVLAVIADALPATLQLALSALAVAVVVGVPLGIVAALNRNKPVDRFVMTFAVLGYSIPNFFLGILLILVFSMWLRVLPSSGVGSAWHLVMPAMTLGTAIAGSLARFIRSSMLEVLNKHYMRTAAAKGVSRERRILAHALPNAAIPLLTVLGFKLGDLVAGAIVTETVFAWPGVGRLLISAVTRRDLAVVQGVLGTDELGRDILSRLIYATRTSIFVAIVGTTMGAILGTILGFIAAHYRGWVEETLMMLVDARASLPFMLIALAVLAFFGNQLTLFILVMGIHGWEAYARLTRGMVVAANTQGYAVAVRALGATPARIYVRHVLPNIVSALIAQFTLFFPATILLESSLSFLGLGIQPPLTSLGQMLGAGRAHLISAWWIAMLPGTVIFLTTLSVSIAGDWLRDRFDPTLRNR
ncbi:MAG: ABC transporter permease subunit, partial [Burkholderiales bacterium]